MTYPKGKSKSFFLTKVKRVESALEDVSNDKVGTRALMERRARSADIWCLWLGLTQSQQSPSDAKSTSPDISPGFSKLLSGVQWSLQVLFPRHLNTPLDATPIAWCMKEKWISQTSLRLKISALWETMLGNKTSHRLGENIHKTYLLKDLYPNIQRTLTTQQ